MIALPAPVAGDVLTLPPPALGAGGDFTIPPNNLLPNYDRVSVGQREALQAGADRPAPDHALANWYNPAGLVQSEKTLLNASSNAYDLTKTTLNGIGQKSSGTRSRPVGGFVGIVAGAPIARSPNWRLSASDTPSPWRSPSDLDGSFNLPAGGGTEAFGYTSSASFGTVIPSLNGAHRLSPTLRVGVGVGYAITTLNQVQVLSDRLVFPATVTTSVRARVDRGSVTISFDRRRPAGPRLRFHGGMPSSPLPVSGRRGAPSIRLLQRRRSTPAGPRVISRSEQ